MPELTLALEVRHHQRLRIVGAARDQRPARRSTAGTAASGTPGPAPRRRPECCSRSWNASKAPNSSAPSSALPGRQEANTVSATQIQPRPLTMSKKNALNADMVRNAPPSAISAEPATTAPMRIAVDVEALRLDRGRVLADRADREAERRAVEQRTRPRANSAKASNVSGVCWNSAGPMNGRSDRPGMFSGRNGSMRRRRRDVRAAHAVGEVGQAGREQRDADAGDVLRQAERHGEERVQQAEGGAGQRRDEHAGPQAAAEIDRSASRPCAPAVKMPSMPRLSTPGALAQQRAEHAEDQRRGDADARRPRSSRRAGCRARRPSPTAAAMWKRTNSPLTSTQSSASATIRSAM